MNHHLQPNAVPTALDVPTPDGASFDLSQLTLQSTLADLPMHHFWVAPETPGEFVATAFKQQANLPGVIVGEVNGRIYNLLSRRAFLENVGRIYGVEVYLNRPIQVMADAISNDYLALPAQTTIQQAAEQALQRPLNRYTEPLIVIFDQGRAEILDIYVLLLAQSYLLRLVNQVEQDRRQLAESLQKTGKALVSSLSRYRVTKRILKELRKVVDYERGTVLLRHADRLEGIAQRGFPKDPRRKQLQVPIRSDRNDVFQQILQTKRPLCLDDVTQEPGWQQLEWLPVNRSWLGIPLIVQDRVIGLISLTRPEAEAFSDDDVTLAQTFAGQAAIALENARLYEQTVNFNEQLEQKVAERTQELNDAYEVLEKLDRTKSDFIKVSAHELRTPLTIIKGYTQVLQIKQDADSKNQDVLDGILEGVERLGHIVNSMLDVAKIDSDALDIYQEAVSLSSAITMIYHSLHSTLQERHLTLQKNGLAALPPVSGDLELLKKVFHALLINAIKYTPDGGMIMVSGQVVSDEEGESAVQVTVGDTGIGIDPAHLELIFEKFYQTGELALHSSGLTKFKGGGPGLGLAIARGIVEAHNGRIWAESEGRDEAACPGSQFHVQLPLRQST